MHKAVGWLILPGLVLVGAAIFLLARPKPPAPEAPPAYASPPRTPAPPPAPAPPKDLPIPAPASEGRNAKNSQARLKEALARLGEAIKRGSVWKDEIKILIELEDLAFRSPDAERVREFLLKTLAEPATGRDLGGLVAFVLTASPTDQGRKDLAGSLWKMKGNDASIVYALTIRNSRIDQDTSAREAFWKGCLSFTERESLMTLGFRERLFKEEYGKSLEDVRRTEVVKPSGADRFDAQVTQGFHALQKKGFTNWVESDDAVRGALIEYLGKGDSPEAKLAVCMVSKPGQDLALAAREAFLGSSSYPDTVRRWLLNRAQGEGAQSGWDVLYDLLPYCGDMKQEFLQRMVSAAGDAPDRQAKTLEILRKEIAQAVDPGEQLGNFVKVVAALRTEEAQNYLFELCRTHLDENVRAAAAGALYSDNLAKVELVQYQKRIACAEEALLKDPSAKVKASAVYSLSWLLSDRGKVFNVDQVRAQVEALVADGQVSERMARPVLEALNQQR